MWAVAEKLRGNWAVNDYDTPAANARFIEIPLPLFDWLAYTLASQNKGVP